eukprot:2466444-Rhodomonas_salina.2
MVWKALRVLLGEQKNADSNGAGENKASAAAAKTRQDEIEESGDAEDDAKEELQRLTAAWVQGQMSNFDYLMEINFLADRSFNDLSQYPVSSPAFVTSAVVHMGFGESLRVERGGAGVVVSLTFSPGARSILGSSPTTGP